ncbi:MAG: hypothetical protein V1656_02530 [Candidatus Jorgensenbacteria bacterium]
MNKKIILKKIIEGLNKCRHILSARAYGSWFYNSDVIDLDIAVMIPSHNGIVESHVYGDLRKLRKSLVRDTRCDIDLIPHTIDEVDNFNSPLWYPRYNPSLTFGKDIKGKFIVKPPHNNNGLSLADIAAYVIFDNRTVCRRQLVRSFKQEEYRIFISKLMHGPGNILTYNALRQGSKYVCSPSDLFGCFKKFDIAYKVSSAPVMRFLKQCRKNCTFQNGLKIMRWYELLVALTFYSKKYSKLYQKQTFII